MIFIENGSLIKAAQQLNISQPALSMQLKRLEQSFDFPIFEFRGKKKELTVYGKALHAESKNILAQVDRGFESFQRLFSDARLQSVKIGCRRELIPKISSAIHFGGSIQFFTMTSAEVVESLVANKIDVGVSRELPLSNEIIAKKFFTSGSHLVISKKWLNGTSISKLAANRNKLMKIPCLVYGDKAELFQEWTKFMKFETTDFYIKYRCEDWVSLLQLVEAGEGFAIMPDTVRSTNDHVEYYQVPVSLVPSKPHYFLYRKGLLKFPAFKDFFAKMK